MGASGSIEINYHIKATDASRKSRAAFAVRDRFHGSVFMGSRYSFIFPSTAAGSGTLVMPPCTCVERLAAVQAKRTICRSSSSVRSAGALPRRMNWLIALPPKISPAPVVSTTRMPEGLCTVTRCFAVAA